MYIIGIDGGGTKTIGYLSDCNSNILAVAKGGTSNYLSAGIDKTKESLDYVISSLCSVKNITKDDIKLISLGLAGAGREENIKIINNILLDIGIKCKTLINNDAYISLVGAHGKSEGIILISGTGSIALGLNKQKEVFRVGGWGHILGDEGSGYYYGREGLTAIMKSYDGRAKPTSISDKVIKYLNLTHIDDLIQYIYSNINDKSRISNLSKLVIEAAEENDEVAKSIVENGIRELTYMITTLINKMGQHMDISLAGGIFDNSQFMKDVFLDILHRENPKLNVIDKKYDAAIGALIVGWEYNKIKYVEKKIINQIKEVDNYA